MPRSAKQHGFRGEDDLFVMPWIEGDSKAQGKHKLQAVPTEDNVLLM